MKAFFDTVRAGPFGGRLLQAQVDGLNGLLAGAKQRCLSIPAIAYILATAYHETAGTMQPVHERGDDVYFRGMYDRAGTRPRVAQRLGNVQPGDGVRFHGRGYVQITGRRNYAVMSGVVGADLVSNPDRALEPVVATMVLFDGMLRGLFTGKALGEYIDPWTCDYRGARRVVNGADRAGLIAGYAERFEIALRAS